jgi:hypothetical protein
LALNRIADWLNIRRANPADASIPSAEFNHLGGE